MCVYYQCLILLLLFSPLWQSCQAQFNAMQEKEGIASEDSANTLSESGLVSLERSTTVVPSTETQQPKSLSATQSVRMADKVVTASQAQMDVVEVKLATVTRKKDEDVATTCQGKLHALEARLAALEAKQETIHAYVPFSQSNSTYYCPFLPFGDESNQWSRGSILTRAVPLGIVTLFVGGYMIRKIRRLESQLAALATLMRQRDADATSSQAQLDALSAQLVTVTRQRDADATSSQAQLDALSAQLVTVTRQRDADGTSSQTQLDALSAQLVTLTRQRDADGTSSQTQLDALSAQLVTLTRQRDADTTSSQAQLDALSARLVTVTRQRDADTTSSQAQLDALSAQLVTVTRQRDADTTSSQAQLDVLAAQLATLTRQRDEDVAVSQNRFNALAAQLAMLAQQRNGGSTASSIQIGQLAERRMCEEAHNINTRNLEKHTYALAGMLRNPDMKYGLFAQQAWKKYFGDVGQAPSLPDNIDDILNTTCPFWFGKRICDTHLLVLIPACVNGQPFSSNLLDILIQSPQCGSLRTKYSRYDNNVQSQIGAVSPNHSYWVLMTRDVLADSRNKAYAEQKEMIARYARQGYALPTALEAATAILQHYVRTGERLLSGRVYTRCQDLITYKGRRCPVLVGDFSIEGLSVDFSNFDYGDDIGVTGCRKL